MGNGAGFAKILFMAARACFLDLGAKTRRGASRDAL